VALTQHHPFVAVYGPSCSGKSTIIQTAVETLKQLPLNPAAVGGATHISCTTIAVGAMREEQLLGYQQHGGDRWVYIVKNVSHQK
jgi:ABC-type lipoprotein export system ATPase subunit